MSRWRCSVAVWSLTARCSIGDIQAFIQYLSQFTQPITQIANIANVLQSTAAAAERVFEFLDERRRAGRSRPHAEARLPVGATSSSTTWTFGYEPGQDHHRGLHRRVAPGQRVAIVGPTGAGKTTMVNLLMRFYELERRRDHASTASTSGDMTRRDVRALFGMVLQDTWLFNGTIRGEHRLRRDRRDARRKSSRPREAAHADHFIRTLPDGYDMELNEEAYNISQGEKQLLTIARAMLADSADADPRRSDQLRRHADRSADPARRWIG